MALLAPVPLRGNRRAATDDRPRTSDPALTPRQRDVLGGLIRGLTNKEIAGELGIGPDAVKRVISRLLLKLDVPSRTALVQYALQTSAARVRRERGPNALSLLDAAPVPAVVTRGRSHLVEYANVTARRILGDAAAGHRLTEVLPAVSRQTIGRVADESFAAGIPRAVSAVPMHESPKPGAAWRRADVHATPIYDGAEKLAGLVLFFLDVSATASDRARPA